MLKKHFDITPGNRPREGINAPNVIENGDDHITGIHEVKQKGESSSEEEDDKNR